MIIVGIVAGLLLIFNGALVYIIIRRELEYLALIKTLLGYIKPDTAGHLLRAEANTRGPEIKPEPTGPTEAARINAIK